MERATEKGLLLSIFGFFGQILFRLAGLVDLGLLCCISLMEMVVLVGIILIYIGRFDYPEDHRKFAKYSIILYIVVHLGIFAYNFTGAGPLGITIMNGARLALISVVSFLLIYKLSGVNTKKILSVALVAALAGGAVYSYLSLPLTYDNAEIRADFEDTLLGWNVTTEEKVGEEARGKLAAPENFRKEYMNIKEEAEENITENYAAVSAALAGLNLTNKTLSALREINGTLEEANRTLVVLGNSIRESESSLNDTTNPEERAEIERELRSLNEESNQTTKFVNTTLVRRGWILDNKRDIQYLDRAVSLLERNIDNIKMNNKYGLINAVSSLLFGLAYMRVYKKVKTRNERLLEAAARRAKEEEGAAEEGKKEKKRRDQRDKKGKERGGKKEEAKRKKGRKGARKDRSRPGGDDILNIEEIKKKYRGKRS